MTRIPHPLLYGALLAAALWSPRAEAGTYKDKNHGFSLRILPDWTQTPTQPGEKIEVAKFKDDRPGDFAELTICRYERAEGAVTGKTEEKDGKKDESKAAQGPASPLHRPPQNAEERLAATLQGMAANLKRYVEGRGVAGDVKLEEVTLPKPKEAKFGKLDGRIYSYTFEPVPRINYSGDCITAGVVAQGTEEYLILYTCPYPQRKLVTSFVSSIKSFRFPGDDAEVEEEEDFERRGRALADEEDLLDPEKRERIKKALVANWRFIDTPHYIVVYNCDISLAKFIAERIEWMRVNAYEVVFPPVEPIKECMVARVCKEMDEYHHYGGPQGSAGYWASAKDELVFPDLSASKKPDETTVGVLQHEGFHQYINYALLKHDPPVWFNEGFAEYFFTVEPKGKRMGFMDHHPERYSVVKNALGTGSLIPLKEFINLSHAQYMQKASLCYAQGWAVATWLTNVTRNQRYKEIPKVYFRELQKGYLDLGPAGDPAKAAMLGEQNKITERALNTAFEGIDLDKMHNDFLKEAKKGL
ncbi:MAG: hypothetical protein AB1578_23250 [Thermodesulfobacteriota bacterium]